MPEGSIRDMEKPLDEKEFQRKLKKDQKALEKEEKKLKAKQKEAARLQAQLASDGAKKSEKKQKKEGATDENPEDFIGPDTPTGQKKLLASQMMVYLVGIITILRSRCIKLKATVCYNPAIPKRDWCPSHRPCNYSGYSGRYDSLAEDVRL